MRRKADDILAYMISLLTLSLDELQSCDKHNEFAYGEKTAYVECLEVIQDWNRAKEFGLNYDIEKRYPL